MQSTKSTRTSSGQVGEPDASWSFHPLTPERWADLEHLFGPRGACGGCWCMWWRRTRGAFAAAKGEGNRAAFQAVVATGDPTGILAYDAEGAVGWCAVAPREDYPRLLRSRLPLRGDGAKVWAITCLFVARRARRRGLSVALIRAAVEQARRGGADIVEGYPVAPRAGRMPDAFAWTGIISAFERAGFAPTERRAASRLTVRLALDS